MARYLSAYAVVCTYLAIGLFALAAPDSGLAVGRRATHPHSAHHPPRHRKAHNRRRARNPRGTSTARAKKKAATKPRRTTGLAIGPPPSSAPKSAAPASPAPESFPSEPFLAQSSAPEEPIESPAPKLPTKPPTSEEPTKAPEPKEPPETPAPEEPTPKEPPSEPTPVPTTQRKLIWSDEFNGSAGASPGPQWKFDTGGGGWGNEELESYTSRPANAELDGQGHLAITARVEKYTGKDGIARDYTSARLQTLNTFKFQYGLVEARIQVPAGQGLVGQFWALGSEAYESSEAWPACGEIDTMEVLGSEPNVVNGTLHAPWSWAPTGVQGQTQSATPLSAGFHTYSVEWEPERISFMLEGSVYKTITPADLPAGAAWPFRHPYFLLMDLAVGGEWPGSPNASTHFPAQMLVDWVHVWQ